MVTIPPPRGGGVYSQLTVYYPFPTKLPQGAFRLSTGVKRLVQSTGVECFSGFLSVELTEFSLRLTDKMLGFIAQFVLRGDLSTCVVCFKNTHNMNINPCKRWPKAPAGTKEHQESTRAMTFPTLRTTGNKSCDVQPPRTRLSEWCPGASLFSHHYLAGLGFRC